MAQVVSRRSIVYDLTFDTRQSKTAASDMDALGKKIDTAANEIQEFSNKTTSAVQRLRQIKNELNNFKGTEERFRALSLEAAKLQDQLNKTNDRIRTLASSTRNIQALISVAQGLTGVFTAVQGATALWGSKNEDLQKTLVKLQGSLALLQGLQAAISTVTEESAAKTVLLTNAQKAYTFVVGSSTGALRVFRLALAATGIGLLIIALGTLIANWDKVKKAIQENTEGFENLKKVLRVFAPLVYIVVKAFEVLVNNFDKIKIAVRQVGEVFSLVFANLGETVNLLLTKQFSKIGKVWENFGSQMQIAFEKGRQKVIDEQAEITLQKQLKRSVRDFKLQKDLLEAQGKDTFEIHKKILQKELQLLDKHSDEYASKLNELNILILKNNEKVRLGAINSISTLNNKVQELQDQLDNTEIGTKQFFALTEQIKLLNIELEAAKDLINGLQELEIIPEAKEIKNASRDAKGFVKVQAEIKEIAEDAQPVFETNRKNLRDTSEVYDLLGRSASAAGQVFANLSQLAADGSQAQLTLSIASVIASQAEALANGVKEAVKIGFPQNIPAIFTTIATITGVFAQIRALSQQANSMKSKGQGNAVAFAEGEVDIHRPGETRGKDSIPAIIMPGESVIKTDRTAQYKPFLHAIQEGTLEDLIHVNYVEPAIAMAAMDNAKNSDKIDYSEKFYRQFLATNEGNSIHKRAASVSEEAATTLKRIEKKIGKGWYV